MDGRYKLCYVDGNWAFFTTQELSKQWGDDWADAPYEHNAGYPYEWSERDDEPKWDVKRVAWDGNFYSPSHTTINSPYSVRSINSGAVPWLSTMWDRAKTIEIFAGTTYPEFLKLIRAAGGHVYLEVDEG